MENALYFAAGAVFGTALLLFGMAAGKAAARQDAVKNGTAAAERNVEKAETTEREEERKRQEKEAEKLRKQFENMMNYTGEVQE